ncbi:TIGR03619 family F420-dependent LLM class oxidoreductase [Streptomyces sp. PA03-1a]|nr:TIGR03619 family F420-dependent LLM class oxidoreductase [Streptomyces sp. PA03-1a]MDX2818719.1 TIGR03619 family F420-dependent LLM class oxidoreductase [Streptomyces sp. PA03-5A]
MTKTAYGMQLPVQSLSTLYAEPWEAAAPPGDLVDVARAADRLGFAYIGCCDHVAIPPRLAPAMSPTWYDPVATLAFLAAVTTRVRLLSHVAVIGLRHPLLTAKQYATLDHLCGGRLILGVGAGHVREEFEALGVDFERRGPLLDEAIDAVRAHFAAGEQKPEPVQRPVPVWVGGSSPAAVRRAALKGDGWLPQGDSRKAMPAQIARLRELRGGTPITIGVIAEPLYVGEPGWPVGRRTLTGKPQAVAESLREYGAMGVDQIQVRFRVRGAAELLDQMEAFADGVAPHLDA